MLAHVCVAIGVEALACVAQQLLYLAGRRTAGGPTSDLA
jgi:hypothetical protein